MSRPDLSPVIGAIARQLIPGWRVEWLWVDAKDINGSLAKVVSNPKRCMVTVGVRWPWPENESLEETLWHELTHSALSPLTDLIAVSDASIMIEEPIVERLSILLAKVPTGVARVMSRAIQELPARLRARVTKATAIKRRVGGNMLSPEQIQKALDALESGDVEACKGALKEILASMASGHAEPDGDEGAPLLAKDPTPGEGIGDAADMGAADRGAYRGKARSAALSPAEVARSRRTLASIEKDGIASLIARERTTGTEIPAEVEKLILTCGTRDDAERMMGIAKLSSGAARARSGSTGSSAGADAMVGTRPLPVTPEALRAEGFDDAWIATYRSAHESDPAGAADFLKGGRERRNTPNSPWTRNKTPNGGN